LFKYIARKLLSGFFVLIGVVLLIFIIFLFINVDPEKMALGQRSDVATEQAIKEKFGLDKPWYVRFGIYLGNVSPVWVVDQSDPDLDYRYFSLIPIGNYQTIALKPPYLGRSFQTDRKVNTMLINALTNTAILALLAITIGMILGLIFGILAALNKGTWIDQATLVLTSIGVSIPSYFSAILLSFVLGYLLRSFTGLNMIGSIYDLEGNLQLKNLILPVLALGIRPVAIITQLTRSAMLDVLKQDYIRTAKAKGLSRKAVVFRHGLRNALNPVITSVSGWFASLLAGAYFVEVIFNFKGLGFLTIQAIETYDFPVIMGSVLIGAVAFIVINILVDILYVLFDPKIKINT
jgi:peptide/nickel transport system permease protein